MELLKFILNRIWFYKNVRIIKRLNWGLKMWWTTTHPWCGSHSTSISVVGVWGTRAGVQVSRGELHTHIHLDYARVEILFCKKKKKKKRCSDLQSHNNHWFYFTTDDFMEGLNAI